MSTARFVVVMLLAACGNKSPTPANQKAMPHEAAIAPDAGTGGSGAGSADPRAGVKLVIGTPTVTGSLDTKQLAAAVEEQRQRLVYCYEKELLAEPGIAGTITVELGVDASGKVTVTSSKGFNQYVGECVIMALRPVSLPKGPGTARLTLTYSQ